jgi:hypothetical protein
MKKGFIYSRGEKLAIWKNSAKQPGGKSAEQDHKSVWTVVPVHIPV